MPVSSPCSTYGSPRTHRDRISSIVKPKSADWFDMPNCRSAYSLTFRMISASSFSIADRCVAQGPEATETVATSSSYRGEAFTHAGLRLRSTM
jgi:hypothetical protein